MKKYILPFIVVLAVLTGYFIYRPSTLFRRPAPQVSSDTTSKLPKDWASIDAKDVFLKLEKNVSGIKPQIVLTISTSPEATTPAKYTDRLIMGVKSTIPSFTVETDKRKSYENLYTAFLSGSYYNQKTKISVVQRVYIQKEKVSVLTASFVGDLRSEVNSILDTLQKDKLGL